jgi:hypothetical protein
MKIPLFEWPPAHEFTHVQGNLGVALFYAGSGIPVFPTRPDKRPLVAQAFHAATTDMMQIIRWWKRWPNALAAIPTGPTSQVWVLDVDGREGRRSLFQLLTRFGVKSVCDLSTVISRTPSQGLHVFFRWQAGETPRNRARDIGAGLDTRGVTAGGSPAGYVIAPGNVLLDGRCYEPLDHGKSRSRFRVMHLLDAPPAAREMLFLATFSKRERRAIRASPVLNALIRESSPAEWLETMHRHRNARATALVRATPAAGVQDIRQQGLVDLQMAATAVSSLLDNRRNGLFTAACRLARYTAHQILTDSEICAALRAAAAANGSLRKYGRDWVDDTVKRALFAGRNDAMPLLARRFQTKRTRL